MRAAVFQGRGRGHRIERLPEPVPGEGQVIIRVMRSGICGSDISFTAAPGLGEPDYPGINATFAPGVVLGHEYAGEVVALGAEVDRLKLGDRIAPMPISSCGHCLSCLSGLPNSCGSAGSQMGGFGQYALASDALSVRFVTPLSWDECALVEPMAASLHATALAGITAGARILVVGAGVMGLGIVYFARRMGAGPIAAVARSDGRAGLARLMGADHFLKQGEDLPPRSTEALGGMPDIVFDTAGVAGVIDQAVLCVRRAGMVVAAALPLMPDKVHHIPAAFKEVRIQYAMAYSLEEFRTTARILSEENVPLRHLATDTVGLDAFPDRFEALRTSTGQCKVLLDPWA